MKQGNDRGVKVMSKHTNTNQFEDVELEHDIAELQRVLDSCARYEDATSNALCKRASRLLTQRHAELNNRSAADSGYMTRY